VSGICDSLCCSFGTHLSTHFGVVPCLLSLAHHFPEDRRLPREHAETQRGEICLTWRFSDLQTSCSLDIVRRTPACQRRRRLAHALRGRALRRMLFQHAQHTGSSLSSFPIMSCLDSCSRSFTPCQSLPSTVLVSFLFKGIRARFVYGNSIFLGCLDPRHQGLEEMATIS
jgi:hypothetical protein